MRPIITHNIARLKKRKKKQLYMYLTNIHTYIHTYIETIKHSTYTYVYI